ncbi:7-cyano-7-deazaguanine synthase QueC [Streptomyces katsurahamanus]|uniref:7-cyano-7-deazaguanine synthase n=1 Tax=Streptomyces katsurahamanus TaxID=2577098 RepID=A0ABW9NZ08_9ACTN|nr:7-cyano-7-deazaguanine synthase QueC [Streptomyces katsurahamanus]MQS38314.1 7-cyano-7-deazaguanine synthase QueC [Streptomyces katsurahamanus]
MTETACPRAVLIASGGMDSTVTAYDLASRGIAVTLLSFDYGQRHRVELDYLEKIAARMRVPHERVDLTGVGRLLAGSALTDASVEVPDGHYSDASMRATVVANRNMIMLSVAAGLAVAQGAEIVASGAHGGDHVIYPDCRPGFFEQMNAALLAGNEGFLPDGFRLEAPFLNDAKADIARRGHELGVPFELTWSCYRGGTVHCGTCGTCTERREAFALANVTDPTRYAGPADGVVLR